MSQHVPLRVTAFAALFAMFLGLPNTAWASAPDVSSTTKALNTGRVEQRQPQGNEASTPAHQASPASRSGFSEEERAKMMERQGNAQELKQYKGGEVIIITSTAILVVLVVILVVVLVT